MYLVGEENGEWPIRLLGRQAYTGHTSIHIHDSDLTSQTADTLVQVNVSRYRAPSAFLRFPLWSQSKNACRQAIFDGS